MDVAEDAVKVAHLKRHRNGLKIGVSIIFVGGMYHPTKRSAKSSNTPFQLQSAALYTGRIAKAWIGSLTRALRRSHRVSNGDGMTAAQLTIDFFHHLSRSKYV